jgi:hypothetical protein
MNKVIEKAIELMDQYKWTQGSYARDKQENPEETFSRYACSFCALGFLGRARYELKVVEGYERAAESLVEAALPEGYFNIAGYNDDPSTTKEDILNLFRKANESSIS